MKKSLTNQLYLKQLLYTIKMKKGMTLCDQALILLCSLPDLFDNFVNSMMYGRDIISLADGKSTLNSMKLMTRLNRKDSDNQAQGLFLKGHSKNYTNFRGRSSERDLGKSKSRGRLQSKSKKKVKCYYCKKYGH